MAVEFRKKGFNMLLGPSSGPLGRSPLGSRLWEGLVRCAMLYEISYVVLMIARVMTRTLMASCAYEDHGIMERELTMCRFGASIEAIQNEDVISSGKHYLGMDQVGVRPYCFPD
jgi:hypothetical protein